MSEEFDDIQEEPLDEEQNLDEEQALDENAQPTGKFTRLLGSDSRKFKLSGMFKDWFLDYSSYVILQRAVPHIVDGLKPVQRRVLHAMYKMDDGRYTKVANIVGQAMQYHPHGARWIARETGATSSPATPTPRPDTSRRGSPSSPRR